MEMKAQKVLERWKWKEKDREEEEYVLDGRKMKKGLDVRDEGRES